MAARARLVCPRARVYVDFSGGIIARHTPMRQGDAGLHWSPPPPCQLNLSAVV